MINSTDVHDLHLEDVEDYSADYPPPGFPQSETNIAAVGMPAEGYGTEKKRTNSLVALMRANKWITAFTALVVVILISMIAIAGGSNRDAEMTSSSDGTHRPPIAIDPKSVNPETAKSLMEKLVSVYERKGLDVSVLDAGAGNTPQRKAFYWLATENLTPLTHTEIMQRYVLAVLYYATNSVKNVYAENPKPWVHATLWLSESHVCEWQGIVCNEQFHIEAIDLERNNLSGSIPLELSIIDSTLQTLDLTSNLIYMEGDQWNVFNYLVELKTLLMDDNYLLYDKGLPSQFKKMEKLKKLRLSYNLFSGELETDHKVLANMPQLTHLEIESNFLSGRLPAVLGEMSNLVYIYMRRNELSMNLDFLKTGKLTDLCKCAKQG